MGIIILCWNNWNKLSDMSFVYVKHLFYYGSVFLGIIILTFFLFNVIPADPARIALGPNADEQQVNALRTKLGLNKPIYMQFADFLKKTVYLDFGNSFIDGRNVNNEIISKFKNTLALINVTVFFIFLYSFFTLMIEKRLYSVMDIINFFFISSPTFFSGVIIALVVYSFYPFTSFSGALSSSSDILYFLPPAFVLALYPMAVLSKILLNDIKGFENRFFIISARAYGFTEKQIKIKHLLRNVIIPYLAALSNQLPMLFTGAFIVEIIFSIPGIGSLLIKSIINKDFPMLQGLVILNGALFISINLFFEFLYTVIDPRIKSGKNYAL